MEICLPIYYNKKTIYYKKEMSPPMKIAIIDDQKQDRDNLREEVTAYFSGKDIPLECDLFAGGEEFLFPAEGRQYDLVFLDIFMEEPDGIQTARILRRTDLNALLVFLTSSMEHMADAFDVHAFGYLSKPLDPSALRRILDDAIKLLDQSPPHLEIPVGRQTVSILLSDIRYVVADSNYIEIHADTQYRSRMSFKKLTGLLGSDGRFFIINRGVLVNLDYIRSMDDLTCRLTDRTALPISRRRTASLKQAYITRQFAIRTKKVSKGASL